VSHTEPKRHLPSERNQRKLIKLCQDAIDEVDYLRGYVDDKLRYASGRLHKMRNRLKCEFNVSNDSLSERE
jgi:hypothetical protein